MKQLPRSFIWIFCAVEPRGYGGRAAGPLKQVQVGFAVIVATFRPFVIKLESWQARFQQFYIPGNFRVVLSNFVFYRVLNEL